MMKDVNRKVKTLEQTNKLKGTKVYIDKDYPKDILEQRKQLIRYMKQARESGAKVKIIDNKLMINDNVYSLKELEEWKN